MANYFNNDIGTNKKWSPSNTSYVNSTYVKMNPKYSLNGKEYDTYRGPDGAYYYKDGNKYIQASEYASEIIAKNNKVSFTDQINTKQNSSKAGSSSSTGSSGGGFRDSSNNTNTQTDISYGGGSGSSGGGSGRVGSGGVNDSYYQRLIEEYRQKIDELQNPKVWTAQELAELYSLEDEYNYEKQLERYNDLTEKYYADAISEQENINRLAELSSSNNSNRLLRNYINSYNNAAPTAVGKGVLAANLLSSMINADAANEEMSTGLNSIVNSYVEKRKDELENNPLLAREQYNNIGKTLLDFGANMNTSDVQNYINTLNAYETAYAGIRNAQNNLASTAASAYQQRAEAALASNKYNVDNAMQKYYQAYYGDNWQVPYRNALNDINTSYLQNSSLK